ncbi:MAG: hypothetical protein ACXVA8_03250, partial [Bdellovibrionota bacterium]
FDSEIRDIGIAEFQRLKVSEAFQVREATIADFRSRKTQAPQLLESGYLRQARITHVRSCQV